MKKVLAVVVAIVAVVVVAHAALGGHGTPDDDADGAPHDGPRSRADGPGHARGRDARDAGE